MAEQALSVPSDYVGTLRRGVMAEVQFRMRGMERDLKKVAESRERHDEDRATFLEGDLGDDQRALGEAGALVSQLPAPSAESGAGLRARARTLEGVVEESVRVCIKDLAEEADAAPLEEDRIRAKIEELGWWVDRHSDLERERVATSEKGAS